METESYVIFPTGPLHGIFSVLPAVPIFGIISIFPRKLSASVSIEQRQVASGGNLLQVGYELARRAAAVIECIEET